MDEPIDGQTCRRSMRRPAMWSRGRFVRLSGGAPAMVVFSLQMGKEAP